MAPTRAPGPRSSPVGSLSPSRSPGSSESLWFEELKCHLTSTTNRVTLVSIEDDAYVEVFPWSGRSGGSVALTHRSVAASALHQPSGHEPSAEGCHRWRRRRAKV